MRIIFVRHGHTDYKNDCLTEIRDSKRFKTRAGNIIHLAELAELNGKIMTFTHESLT